MSINTGSVTIVNGRPTAVYNGGILRNGTVEGQSVAWAANLSDPLLAEWHNPSIPLDGYTNPIVPLSPPLPSPEHCPSFRDDSAAWRSGGQWKMIASGCGAQLLYTSADFVSWKYGGKLFDEGSECPSFWRLEPSPLTGDAGGLATHVLKTGVFRLGTYDEAAQRFLPLPGSDGQPFPVQDGADGYSFDTYAGKDFVDAVGRRRWYDWVQESTPASVCNTSCVPWTPACCVPTPWPMRRTWGSMLSLSYVLSYEPERLPNKLLQNPPPELHLLRTRQEVDLAAVSLVTNCTLGKCEAVHALTLPAGSGSTMEVIVRWARPSIPGQYELGVRLLEGAGGNGTTEVTVVSMVVDILSQGQVSEGKVECMVDRRLASSLAHFAGGYPFFDKPFLRKNATVPLSAVPEELLSMHIVVDKSIVESFFLGGLSRQTGRVYPHPTSLGLSLFAKVGGRNAQRRVEAREVSVWALGSGWTSVDEVMRQWQIKNPRLKADETDNGVLSGYGRSGR
jgi:hypothetical protein